MKVEYIQDNSGVSKGAKRDLPNSIAKYLIDAGIVKEDVVIKKELKPESTFETKENKVTKKTKSNK